MIDGRKWQGLHQAGYTWNTSRKPSTLDHRLWSQSAQGTRACSGTTTEAFRRQDHRLVLLQAELRPIPYRRTVFPSLWVAWYRMRAWLILAYEDLYQSPTIVPENVRSLPLVFIVLAMAVRLAPEEWAGDDQTRKLSSLRLYWSCESFRRTELM
jgi:hypothetical protein